MKTLHSTIGISLLIILTSCNTASRNDNYQYVSPASEHTIIWKIEGNGMTETSYILGTMHSQHASFLDNIEGWDSIFDKCKTICVESLILPMGATSGKSSSSVTDCLMPADTTYEDILGDDIEDILPYAADLKYRPYVIRNKFVLSLYSELLPNLIHNKKNEIGISEDYKVMDEVIQNRALRRGKSVVFLDGVMPGESSQEEQSKGNSLMEDVLALHQDITHRDSIMNFQLMMDSAYYFRDVERLSMLVDQDSLVYTKRIMFERNEKWMQNIVASLQKQSTLVAVGIAHLIPTKHDVGILQRLKDIGYRIKPY